MGQRLQTLHIFQIVHQVGESLLLPAGIYFLTARMTGNAQILKVMIE